jgi:GntR family transcriptional regulator, transcriptional repressor for pyruvate dehydrogenase complex
MPERDNGSRSGPGRTTAITFEPIEQLRAHEYVAEQLRRQIGLHIIPAGGVLPTERELSAMFGVGRATVQAAVRLLEADRIVETRRGRHGGTFVTGITDDDIAMDYLLVRLRRSRHEIVEALAFRRDVDRFAASLAAVARTEDELAQIELANQRTIAADTDLEFMAFDTEFHLAIARAAQNRYVYEGVERMRLVLGDALTALPDSPAWRKVTAREHRRILDAIARRDGNAAGRAMERHAASTEKSISDLLAAL